MAKIMIADDVKDIREMLESLLQNEGFETETAVNGVDFLEKVDSFHPYLVSLDVMMPGLSTEEIFEKMKGKNCKPKILLLTVVRYDHDDKNKLFDLGNVVDYIKKPFELDDLIDVVKKHIGSNTWH